MWANCQRSSSSGYHAEFHEVVIRRIPISDAGGQCETNHRLSWKRRRVVAAHYKKTDLLHCWTSSRIFLATMRTFAKDTALSEQSRGVCELTHGMAGERHAMCESAFNVPWVKVRGSQPCNAFFSHKVTVNEPPPGSPTGAPMERAASLQGLLYIPFKFLIKISLNIEIFPFSQRP